MHRSDMLLCMRTTLEINEQLFRRAKKRAAEAGTPFRAIVEAALLAHLEGRPVHRKYKFRWRTECGKVMPGVRLDDRDALFDLMDRRR